MFSHAFTLARYTHYIITTKFEYMSYVIYVILPILRIAYVLRIYLVQQ